MSSELSFGSMDKSVSLTSGQYWDDVDVVGGDDEEALETAVPDHGSFCTGPQRMNNHD